MGNAYKYNRKKAKSQHECTTMEQADGIIPSLLRAAFHSGRIQSKNCLAVAWIIRGELYGQLQHRGTFGAVYEVLGT